MSRAFVIAISLLVAFSFGAAGTYIVYTTPEEFAAPPISEDKMSSDWADLIPMDAYGFVPVDGVTEELWNSDEFQAQLAKADKSAVMDMDGKWVKMPGFMVPLAYDGDQVTSFLLVPDAGQCIHVPPPPANQTITIDSENPIAMRDLYQPIEVIGQIQIAMSQNQYTESTYRIINPRVDDFTEDGYMFPMVEGGDGDRMFEE